MNAVFDIAILIRNGKSVRQSADAGGLPITRIETIADGTINPVKVGFAGLAESDCADWLLQDGDILISHINSTKHLGKCAIYDGRPPALVHGMNLLVLRVDQAVATPRYVYRMLSSPSFRRQLPRITKDSVNQSSFNISNFKKLELPLPPLAEQKRIAGILDAADALRAKRRESLVQLDTLLQSTFLDMFGDPVGNGWEIVAVEDVGRGEKGAIRTGPFGSQLLHSEFVDEGILVLGIDNVVANEFREGDLRFITPQKYEQLRRYTVRPGDVLITIMGTCGRCAVVPDDIGKAINTKHLCCITLDREKCLPEFVHAYFLEHPIARRYLERSAKGAIMSGLNMGIIKALPIPVPPLDLQQHFAAIVESVEQQKARQSAHLDELDNLFASLQSRAFRGDL